MANKTNVSKIPWKKYKLRFLAHEWETITQMKAALKLPSRTTDKHVVGWHEERDEVDTAMEAESKELIIHDGAQAQLDIYRDIRPMLQELFLKGINQLLAKKRTVDPRTGAVRMEDVPFASEATALGASRFGLAGLKVLESGVLPGAIGGGQGNPLILDGDALNALNIPGLDPKSFTTAQLQAALDSLDTDEGTEAGNSKGAPIKERSARKRS